MTQKGNVSDPIWITSRRSVDRFSSTPLSFFSGSRNLSKRPSTLDGVLQLDETGVEAGESGELFRDLTVGGGILTSRHGGNGICATADHQKTCRKKRSNGKHVYLRLIYEAAISGSS